MHGLSIALPGSQEPVEDLQPTVGEGTQRLIVTLPRGALAVVEGACPLRARQRAEGPAQQRLAQEAVAGPAGDDGAPLAGGFGVGGGPSVSLKRGGGRESLATVPDLAHYPGGEPRIQPGQAHEHLAVRVTFLS